MATLNLADGESFVKGRSMAKAQELLELAGDRATEVRTTSYGYVVPTEILPEGYEAITKADLPAVTTEPGTSTNVDEVFNKGGEPTGTPAKEEIEEEGEEEGEALYDPADHTISEVEAYLEEADDEEHARVIAAEAEGKQRKGVLDLAKTAKETE